MAYRSSSASRLLSSLSPFLFGNLAVALLFSAAFKGLLALHATSDLATLTANEAAKVEIAGRSLERSIEMASSDVRAIAHTPTVEALVAHDDHANRERVARLFGTFAREKQIYDQVRYLDAAGMERVRINLRNGNPERTPEAELQDKGGRYFFRDAIRLQPGEVYVSPLDLNIENGSLEIPYKPMVRVGTPMFDAHGERKGLVLLNLYGQELLWRFHRIMGKDYRSMLLNRDGDWLVAPDAVQEWGFMFGQPGEFARRYPQAWQQLRATEHGSWLGEEGLYSFVTVYPLLAGKHPGSQHSATGSARPVGSSEHPVEGNEFFWKVVSLVPREQLPSSAIFATRTSQLAYLGGLASFLALTSYLLQVVRSRRRLRSQLLLTARRHKEILDNLAEGVAVLDRAGRVVEVNPEAERLLGWERDELLGQDAHALFHSHPQHQQPGERCPIRRVADSGEVYRSEEEVFNRKDGSPLPVGVTAAPLTSDGTITGSVLAFRDIGELKRQQEAVQYLAYHDTLTGLPNRRLLIDRLELALGLAERHGRNLALMFLDLDHFKQINDCYGHEGGDELLKGVARRLATATRDTDTIARQSGDEFVILLPEIDSAADAEQVAQRILGALRAPLPVQGQTLAASVSIGIALYPGDADSADGLMRQADLAMYAAKQGGRNRYCRRGMTPTALEDCAEQGG